MTHPLTSSLVRVICVAGIDSGLQLDAATLGNIYSCQITMWDDPAITALNAGTKCALAGTET